MKKLKGLWKIIFGRTAILVFLMVIQAVILFGGFAVLDNKILIVNYGVGILAVIILMYVLNTRQNSSYKMMWIIFILVVPVIGVSFYIYTKLQPGTKFIAGRVGELLEEEAPFLKPNKATENALRLESKIDTGLFKYLHEYGKYPTYCNASVKYFPLGEDKFNEMLYQLEQAKEFIFL